MGAPSSLCGLSSRIDPALWGQATPGCLGNGTPAVLTVVCRKSEAEGRPCPGRGFVEPDTAPILLDDPLADRQAYSTSVVLLAAVEALENREDLLGIVRLNANAIIRYREQVPAVALAGRNMDARRLAAAIFDGVADQVLEIWASRLS